jgi:hypothetical protein
VEAARRHPARAELVGLRSRDGDDGVEPPKCESLQRFVPAVLPPATGKTVYGGYYWHVGLMARMATYDV